MRSRALHRALSFHRFSTFLSPFPPSFSPPYYPGFLRCVSNHLPFAYISLPSLSSTPLHHEIQLRFIPPKLIFILLDSLACPKISITIYLVICLTHAACCMLHACTKTPIAFVGPWRIKSGGDDLVLSRNRLHLSCSSRFVFINYINTQCLQ